MNKGLSISFAVMLLFGFIAQFLPLDINDRSENRTKAKLPSLSQSDNIPEFARAVDAWFADHFNPRSLLLLLSSHFKVNVLGSPSSRDVILGSNGRLYFGGERAAVSARNALPFTEKNLDDIIAALVNRSERLEKRGIRYILAIAPDASSMYPEDLPSWAKSKALPNSRLDQLMASVEAYNRKRGYEALQVLDLRLSLLIEKAHHKLPLYQSTDSHWNDLGAFFASRAMINFLGRVTQPSQSAYSIPVPFELNSYEVKTVRKPGGDLAQMLGLSESFEEVDVQLSFKGKPRFNRVVKDWRDFETTLIGKGSVKLPSAIIFRDSFGARLQPLLAEYFSRARWVWQRYNQALVDSEDVDIVIEEFVERALNEKPFEEVDF